MEKVRRVDYLGSSVAEARWWIEVCHEDDCQAFRGHAVGIIRQILRELPQLLDSTSPIFKPLQDALARAYSALVVGQIHEADEALQEAIEYLQWEVFRDAKEASAI